MALKRKSRIKRTSRSKQKELRLRREFLAKLERERGQMCEVSGPSCTGTWVDGHEKLPRSAGGDPLDKANVLLVCRRCHDCIHANPAISYEIGWLVRRT